MLDGTPIKNKNEFSFNQDEEPIIQVKSMPLKKDSAQLFDKTS